MVLLCLSLSLSVSLIPQIGYGTNKHMREALRFFCILVSEYLDEQKLSFSQHVLDYTFIVNFVVLVLYMMIWVIKSLFPVGT